MTRIVVDPASIKRYGSQASDQFAQINQQLQQLVEAVATVDYHGTNAFEFKTKSADMAAEYATAMHSDMKQAADAVRTATSQIARSLGGQPISIAPPAASSVSRPAVSKGDGTEEVSTEALEALIPRVTTFFNKIDDQLDAHLKGLRSTKWEGQAKESAARAVTQFTQSAKQISAESQQTLTKYIRDQIDATTAADKTLG